jgi:hypothetical protein
MTRNRRCAVAKPGSKARRRSNPWDRAKGLPVVRGNHVYPPAPLEDGVKFFVLMLEQIGCEPVFSCEGHPTGFYVMFRGPEPAARAVARCGFFRVELCDEEATYCMRLYGQEAAFVMANGEALVEENRVRCLRWAATAWVRAFGELEVCVKR